MEVEVIDRKDLLRALLRYCLANKAESAICTLCLLGVVRYSFWDFLPQLAVQIRFALFISAIVYCFVRGQVVMPLVASILVAAAITPTLEESIGHAMNSCALLMLLLAVIRSRGFSFTRPDQETRLH